MDYKTTLNRVTKQTLKLGVMLNCSIQRLGLIGECITAKHFMELGYSVQHTAYNGVGYDLSVNGLRVEVKTARQNKRNTFQVCVNKTNHTDISYADLLVINCIPKIGSIRTYAIPVNRVTSNQLTIGSSNSKYEVYRIL